MQTEVKEKAIKENLLVEVDYKSIAVIEESDLLAEQFDSFKITTNQENTNSLEFAKQVHSKIKELDEERKILVTPLNELTNKINDLYNPTIKKLKNAKEIIKEASKTFQIEQQRLERQRQIEAEAKAKAEEDKKRKALEERAKKEAEKGNGIKAEMLMEKASEVYVQTVVKPQAVEQVKGTSTTTVWKARIQDISKIPPLAYLGNEKVRQAIESHLNSIAKTLKSKSPYAGVEFYPDMQMSIRG